MNRSFFLILLIYVSSNYLKVNVNGWLSETIEDNTLDFVNKFVDSVINNHKRTLNVLEKEVDECFLTSTHHLAKIIDKSQTAQLDRKRQIIRYFKDVAGENDEGRSCAFKYSPEVDIASRNASNSLQKCYDTAGHFTLKIRSTLIQPVTNLEDALKAFKEKVKICVKFVNTNDRVKDCVFTSGKSYQLVQQEVYSKVKQGIASAQTDMTGICKTLDQCTTAVIDDVDEKFMRILDKLFECVPT